ncbi:homocysteine S-methyltransferase family protein [Paraburkholderia sp.]|uniref:homocysteine S-methyltransferase family protein n=1 Tax=Paraburkholderia sp. TaxID=1926495 RepID=UPI0025F5DC6E|nr:homocysteine S-methyltransferase family protein [Paraburkholderia sp.]
MSDQTLMSLRLRLASKMPVLLDGATATELQRRGFKLRPPLWSAEMLLTPEGRAALLEIHGEYVEAGADIITANTFRTTRKAVAESDRHITTAELTAIAIGLARQAVDQADGDRQVLIAGSLAPVADAYRPEDTPSISILRKEHRDSIAGLLDAGADLILAETINTWREAQVIGAICREMQAPFIVSFVCDPYGLLLGGENYSPLQDFVAEFAPLAISVNCSNLAATHLALTHLASVGHLALGAYPNVEDRAEESVGIQGGYLRPNVSTRQFVEFISESASRYGLSLVGGCCGTSPRYIAALRKLVDTGAI